MTTVFLLLAFFGAYPLAQQWSEPRHALRVPPYAPKVKTVSRRTRVRDRVRGSFRPAMATPPKPTRTEHGRYSRAG